MSFLSDLRSLVDTADDELNRPKYSRANQFAAARQYALSKGHDAGEVVALADAGDGTINIYYKQSGPPNTESYFSTYLSYEELNEILLDLGV